MYNRYIPSGASYTRVSEPDGDTPRRQPPHSPEPHREPRQEPQEERRREQRQEPRQEPRGTKPQDPISSLLSGLSGFTSGKKNAGLSGILEKFKLDDIDTGDILLILILLFLFRDGDDTELVITLGLILLLGLGDKEKD